MLLQRGIQVSYEAIRYWCNKFGQTFANAIRKQRGRAGDHWHVDEVFVRINGKTHYLFRAVDQDGEVLNRLLQSRRSKKATLRFFRKLLKKQGYCPQVLVTDKLKSCPEGSAPERGTSHREAREQPGGELPSTHAGTRAEEEAVQVPR